MSKEELFGHIKKLYHDGDYNWHKYHLTFSNMNLDNPEDMLVNFSKFSNYLINAYNLFFCKTARGPAFVTTVSEQGIRIQYINGTSWDWIHTDEIEKFGLVKLH